MVSPDAWPLTPSMAGKILNLGSKGSPRESHLLHKTTPLAGISPTSRPSLAIASPALVVPSSLYPSTQTLSRPRSPSIAPNPSTSTMSFEVSTELRSWLTTHGLAGYLQVYDADAHPRALAIAAKIHPGTITNDIIRSALRLPRGGEYNVEAPPHQILEKYFGEYSLSPKAHRMHGSPNKLFGDLAHFFLKYMCIHQNPHSMPKKKAGLIILAHEGRKIDWGCITGEGIRAALASFKTGKRFLPVLAQYTAVLYPQEPQTT